MRREIVWSTWDGRGMEHLRLEIGDGVILADGMILSNSHPFRTRYEVRCDAGWRVRELRLAEPGSEVQDIHLLADGRGNWTTPAGETVPELEGCVDADISATPFTNTIAIRRLELAPGESVGLPVAYVDAGEVQVWKEDQRYTCLQRGARGGIYRFEALDGGFTADLPVDADGLVLDYPGLFRRVLAG